MLPDPRSLYRLKEKHRSFEGVNYLQYSRFFDEVIIKEKFDKILYGHLLVDEMKLKNGLVVNIKDDSLRGFVDESDGYKLDNEIKNLLSREQKKPKKNQIKKTWMKKDLWIL